MPALDQTQHLAARPLDHGATHLENGFAAASTWRMLVRMLLLALVLPLHLLCLLLHACWVVGLPLHRAWLLPGLLLLLLVLLLWRLLWLVRLEIWLLVLPTLRGFETHREAIDKAGQTAICGFKQLSTSHHWL